MPSLPTTATPSLPAAKMGRFGCLICGEFNVRSSRLDRSISTPLSSRTPTPTPFFALRGIPVIPRPLPSCRKTTEISLVDLRCFQVERITRRNTKQRLPMRSHTAPVNAIMWSAVMPQYLVSGGEDSKCLIWDFEKLSGQCECGDEGGR